ncbi:MAG: hypothetical protein AAGG01_10070, partial [Planctomycetota bacterium]
MKFLTCPSLALLALSSAPVLAATQEVEAAWTVPVAELQFEGEGPNWRASGWMRSLEAPALLPRVVVPGWESSVELPVIRRTNMPFAAIRGGNLALRGPRPSADGAAEATGTLFLVNPGADALVGYPFTIPAGAAKSSDGRWRAAEASRYVALATAGIPGTAWFRRRADSLGGPLATNGEEEPLENWRGWRSFDEGETYAMFTGGRALAENLALDDVIGVTGDEHQLTVDISELEKVTVPPMDFGPLIEGVEVKLDPLSDAIPHDQHAVFFPSFDALVEVVDQIAADAAPLVQQLSANGMSARVRERYETQMCLGLDGFTRALGGRLVESVALTGSDTYLRTGSDVAVLLGGDVRGIAAMMESRVTGAAKEFGVEPERTEMSGVAVLSAVSADRALSVYVASADGFVLVSNSPVQLERVLAAKSGRILSLDELAEYRWFRERYPIGAEGEDAFAVVTDAAIRRWAGPHWRIATSRRTKAAAVLSDADAWRVGHDLGVFAEDEARAESGIPDGGPIHYGDGFASEATYGSLGFLTPIAELDVGKVSPAERDGYERWRIGYERAWTANFDPIAVRLSAEDHGLEVDLTLVPLIVRTQYRDLINIAGDVELAPDSGDFHDGAIAHWVTAIDTESRLYREVTGFIGGLGNGRFGLDWVGEDLAIYLDEDLEYFASLDEADSLDAITEEMLPGLPVGVRIDVKSPLKLAAFLTGLRGFLEDAVPGMFDYQARDFAGAKYVAIVPMEGALFPETPSLYYAAMPDALVLSFSESLIQRAMARSAERREVKKGGEPIEPAPWTGSSTGLHLGEGFHAALAVDLFQVTARQEIRGRSWVNLPILNEWRRMGAEDPVAFHENATGIRLLCPGGGEYVWNERFETMESTVFGHPAEPKAGPSLPAALAALK